jgi:scyllo-inositol 2-dehydrogenase (NADP+)
MQRKAPNKSKQKNSKSIRIGVIGLGRIGWDFHCKTLATHPQFSLVGVADTDPQRCREAEDTYGCVAFADYRDLLKLEGLEMVVVAAPTHLHKEIALAAFRRDLHVYMEKPLAVDLAQARSIVRAAQRKNKVLSVYQPHRAMATNRHLAQILDSGVIGQVYQVRYGRFNCVRRDDWQSLRRYGGGMLNNYGAHYLDMLLHLLGYDVKRAFCQLRRVLSLGDTEDVVKIVIEMRNGAIGEVDINQAAAISPFELEVLGTRGAIALENDVFHLRFFADKDLAPKKLNRSLASAGRQYPKDQIPFKEQRIPVDKNLKMDLYADLARAIRQGKEPFVKPQETLDVMRLMQQCRQDSGKILVTP